jgi:hypothetical protein
MEKLHTLQNKFLRVPTLLLFQSIKYYDRCFRKDWKIILYEDTAMWPRTLLINKSPKVRIRQLCKNILGIPEIVFQTDWAHTYISEPPFYRIEVSGYFWSGFIVGTVAGSG